MMGSKYHAPIGIACIYIREGRNEITGRLYFAGAFFEPLTPGMQRPLAVADDEDHLVGEFEYLRAGASVAVHKCNPLIVQGVDKTLLAQDGSEPIARPLLPVVVTRNKYRA